ncbi:MAG: ABC transporter ATP-binding protein [Bdellovibrionales bacterium]
MKQPLLRVEDFKVFYGAIEAVKGVNFEIMTGEIVSLIGCNGAGKSSTLRGLSGVVKSTGKVSLLGKNISNLSPHQRVLLGLIHCPEGRGLFPHMSVEENLEIGTFFRIDRANLQRDYEVCFSLFPRVKERLHQMAGTLSGGEQQMVAICRAILAQPKILLLDEPSLGLAPLVVAQIFSVIKTLNQQGTTILLVEQNAKQALRVSHRAYVLETGEIPKSGTGKELLENDEIRKSYLGI